MLSFGLKFDQDQRVSRPSSVLVLGGYRYFMIILVENGYYPIQSLGVDAAISSLRHERVFGDHYLLVQIMSFL